MSAHIEMTGFFAVLALGTLIAIAGFLGCLIVWAVAVALPYGRRSDRVANFVSSLGLVLMAVAILWGILTAFVGFFGARP